MSRATWSVFCLVDLMKPRNSSSDTARMKRALKDELRNKKSLLKLKVNGIFQQSCLWSSALNFHYNSQVFGLLTKLELPQLSYPIMTLKQRHNWGVAALLLSHYSFSLTEQNRQTAATQNDLWEILFFPGRILFDFIHFPKMFRIRIVTLSSQNHGGVRLKINMFSFMSASESFWANN